MFRKSFVALGLPSSHEFWKSEEKPLPVTPTDLSAVVKPPLQIVCNTGNHHFLLSSGQFCPWPLKATEAKYGKFACKYTIFHGDETFGYNDRIALRKCTVIIIHHYHKVGWKIEALVFLNMNSYPIFQYFLTIARFEEINDLSGFQQATFKGSVRLTGHF